MCSSKNKYSTNSSHMSYQIRNVTMSALSWLLCTKSSILEEWKALVRNCIPESVPLLVLKPYLSFFLYYEDLKWKWLCRCVIACQPGRAPATTFATRWPTSCLLCSSNFSMFSVLGEGLWPPAAHMEPICAPNLKTNHIILNSRLFTWLVHWYICLIIQSSRINLCFGFLILWLYLIQQSMKYMGT